MTTTVIDRRHVSKDPGTELATELANESKLTDAAWYLHRHRVGALNRSRDPFNVLAWLEALNASGLPSKDKDTGAAIARTTDWYGQTLVNRYDLAADAGVTRVMTITARTKRLEAAGFITIKQRYNQSSIISLTVPLDAALPHHDHVFDYRIINGATVPDAADLHDSEVKL